MLPYLQQITVLLAILLSGVEAAAQLRSATIGSHPRNLDFEKGKRGDVPFGWTLQEFNSELRYSAASVAEHPAEGRRCAVLSSTSSVPVGVYGNLVQTIDARPFRGKLLRFSATVRTANLKPESLVGLSLRVDRKDKRLGFVDNMFERPIQTVDWKRYEIVGEVADDAESISFGLLLFREGTAWIDSAQLESYAMPQPEPPGLLSEQTLAHVTAFARLLGYVRYFHPSDEAQRVDWNSFALWGMRQVQFAHDAAQLAVILRGLFATIAPTVQVFLTSQDSGQISSSMLPRAVNHLSTVHWIHHGFGSDPASNNMYSSERVKEKLVGKTYDSNTFAADLEGGISVRIPLRLLVDDRGTLPHAARAQKKTIPSFYSIRDRAARLAIVALFWNVPQHFYPYFDVVNVDWGKALQDALTSAATDQDEVQFFKTLRRLAASLSDGHAQVMTIDQPRYRLPLTWDLLGGDLVIVRVDNDALTIKPGDIILGVDGKLVKDAISGIVPLIPASTPQNLKSVALTEIAAGPKDSLVTLDVLPRSGKPYSVTLARRQRLHPFWLETRPDKISEIRSGILYVDLQRCSPEEFEAALPILAAARGIIFDVRGYPFSVDAILSHLIEAPITGPQFLVPVITQPDRQGLGFVSSPRAIVPREPHFRAKSVFLMNGRAMSRSETLLTFVEDNHLGPTVGSPTAGTNGNIVWIGLPGRYRVGMTAMKTLRKDGSRFHGLGLKPTVPVERTKEGIAENHDEILNRGLEVVEGMIQGSFPFGSTRDASRQLN